jgi:protoheme IX farnesyltransferase
MSTTSLACEVRRSQGAARVTDYIDLARPRIAAMVLVTVTVGALVGAWGAPSPLLVLHALVGTALVATSAGALNQWLERDTDSRMPRTAGRAIPAGRLAPGEVLAFGAVTAAAGLAYLAVAVNWPTAALGLATWVLYVWVYTPLKRRGPVNTAVGAVAGAMPVLMGWTAVEGRLGLDAATLFTMVYLWQFPHFMAIAWIYREEYAHAGLQMLPVVDPSGRRTGRQAVAAATALMAVSLLPPVGLAAPACLLGALAVGLVQTALAVRFCRRLDLPSARGLLRASLISLPTLLVLVVLARWF